MKRSKLTRFQKLVLIIGFALSTILPSVACQGGDAMNLTCAADPNSADCQTW